MLTGDMILTIDVGLKNLAMCVMSGTDMKDLKTYTIHLWDVFNTLETESPTLCNGVLKTGKVCGKKSTCFYIEEEQKHYCCKTHFPKSIKFSDGNKIKNKKVDDFLLQTIAWIVISKIKQIFMENLNIFRQIKKVFIELQPKINQKMKFTSHILYGKLVELYAGTNTIIRFVRAAAKLKAYTGPPLNCHLKGAYAKRKWMAVQYTKWFLENKFSQEQRDIWLPDFLVRESPDRSDTFLMAINAIHGLPVHQTKTKKNKCIK